MAKKAEQKSVADQIAEDKEREAKAAANEKAEQEAKDKAAEKEPKPAPMGGAILQKSDKQLLGYLAISSIAGNQPNPGWMKAFAVTPGFGPEGVLKEVTEKCAGEAGEWKGYAVMLTNKEEPRLVPLPGPWQTEIAK